MLLPHRTLFCLLLGILAVQFVSSQEICSSNQRCEPESETFSIFTNPIVNSTCGSNPPYSFCLRTYDFVSKTILTENCSYVCNSSSEMDSHGPDKMTDFDRATWWQSESGVDTVSIEIALGFPVQIEIVAFDFVSFIPNALYIEKSTDNGVTFEPFYYVAADCMAKYMIDPDIENETGVLCFEYEDFDHIQEFGSRNRRPEEQLLTKDFYDFVTITNVRVILDEHYYSINQSEYYYALADLSVTGHCQCNGHASICDRSTGICTCSHNTMGDSCGQCFDLYNDLKWDVATNSQPFECKSMNHHINH